MDMGVNDAVGIAGDDLGRGADRRVARRKRADRGLRMSDVLAVGAKVERPQHERQAGRLDEAGRRRIGGEHGLHRRCHPGHADRQRQKAPERRPEQGMGPDLVIPGDAARPGMADGRDQRQRAHEVGRLKRQCEARDAPERMADDNRLSDPEALRCERNYPPSCHGARSLNPWATWTAVICSNSAKSS
jgi:hypothetical protein